jgi:hypothetical protein
MPEKYSDMKTKEGKNSKQCALGVCNNENGVALILALIMLLVMSVLATTVSFNSNNDFHAMSNYKQSQEAFLAAERCIQEGRRRIEIFGVGFLYLLQQNSLGSVQGSDNLLVLDEELESGARCRSGRRTFDGSNGPGEFIRIPPPTKAFQRPVKGTSFSGASFTPVLFFVMGKDSRDKDKDDASGAINTGTEIQAGIEGFVQGDLSSFYSPLN